MVNMMDSVGRHRDAPLAAYLRCHDDRNAVGIETWPARSSYHLQNARPERVMVTTKTGK